jgi:hypothetical protein
MIPEANVLAAVAGCILQGMYTLVLEFESKMEFQMWEDRLPKIQSFFGPGGHS